jgi:hypothetical protein
LRLCGRRRLRRRRQGCDILVPRLHLGLRLELRANDLRLHDDVVGAANHQEMFDIVASHDDELTLSVERKSVDQPQAWLARLAAAGKTQPMTEQRPISNNQRSNRHDHYSGEHGDLQWVIVAKRKTS